MIDLSPTTTARVYLLTALGTFACVLAAFTINGFMSEAGGWQLGPRWLNSILIPLVIAPPFFFFLLTKLRELSITHAELLKVASSDPLTNCLNRRAFATLIEAYLNRLDGDINRQDGALLILDVDNFKAVNDLFGHDEGDEALLLIARVIRENVREVDLVARLGGEEFGVFLPSSDDQKCRAVAERIRKAVYAARFAPAGERHLLSLSIGGVTFTPPANYPELYRYADKRLYVAKRTGRNRVQIDRMIQVYTQQQF